MTHPIKIADSSRGLCAIAELFVAVNCQKTGDVFRKHSAMLPSRRTP